ncbi:hypothetical protein L210DRAFT_3553144 [Boletus edulis BED1]|uniref:Uncharacterized protein n=1 Tax=Boletus edulis BED1 TaxID=1328754 RepID=A0AAD4BMN6_BOLED|nr:hypothetical protein L210DRAFT_3553144 [Boletus edulis BED1]
MPLAPSPADASAFTVQTQQRTQRKSPSIGELSIVQRSSTTVEVRGHDTAFPSFLGTSEYFYDSRAGYENPLITAASRSLISDIHTLTRRCCAVDVPRPLSLLHTLLRARPPNELFDDPWFKAVRIWAEVDDICETESFDGHKKSFVEYTLNILFFPDLHTTYRIPKILVLHRPPPSPADSQLSLSVPSSPSLPIPGTPCSMPSPLHFQLPVMTRLCFNEQGQITYHRDIWDFRDVVRLIPGVRVVLWIVARAGAWGLSWISQKVCSNMDADAQHEECVNEDNALLTSPTDSNV